MWESGSLNPPTEDSRLMEILSRSRSSGLRNPRSVLFNPNSCRVLCRLVPRLYTDRPPVSRSVHRCRSLLRVGDPAGRESTNHPTLTDAEVGFSPQQQFPMRT